MMGLNNLNYEIHWKVFDDRSNLLHKGKILSERGFEKLNSQQQDLVVEQIYKGFKTSDFLYKNLITGEEKNLEDLGCTLGIYLHEANGSAYAKYLISDIAKQIEKQEREATMFDGGLGRTFF